MADGYSNEDRKELLVTDELYDKALQELPQKQKSISDLIVDCQEQARKMSTSNPNKLLLLNCAYAMRQLVDRLAFHEDKTKVS